jgi:Ca-activated chloride channel family protein
MMTFAYLWIFLLLPLPWLLRVVLPPRRQSQVAVRVPFGYRLRQVVASRSTSERVKRGPLRWLMPYLIWLLLLTSLARPQWIEPPVTKNLPTRDLLLLVDLSGSMSQEDFTNAAGKKVDRLTAVKEVVGDFLQRREGDRVGLVVFGDAPFPQALFSTDLNLSRRLLEETAIGMAGPRTAFGDAIGLGVGLFDQSDAPSKTVIALTDGNDTRSQVPPVEAARVAAQRGIRIHTVAIGDPQTVGEEKLDEAALREVAEAAGGQVLLRRGSRANWPASTPNWIVSRRVRSRSSRHRPRRDMSSTGRCSLALLVSLARERTMAVILRQQAGASAATPGSPIGARRSRHREAGGGVHERSRFP